jgi:hypothetical protein
MATGGPHAIASANHTVRRTHRAAHDVPLSHTLLHYYWATCQRERERKGDPTN